MPIHTVDPITLKEWLNDGSAILIDVREIGEYQLEHIPESHLIPLNVLCEENLPNIINKKLVVHCKMGKRGSKACETLTKENPELTVFNLQGGITAWVNAGLPVIS